jgi:hypothetical protein
LLLLLFRNRADSAAELLRELDVQLPEYDDIRADSSELNDLRPAEYRADLVLLLMSGSQKVLGVIVEVQLGRDEDKSHERMLSSPFCRRSSTGKARISLWPRALPPQRSSPLELRFGTLTAEDRTRVRGAQDAQLDAVTERMFTAKTLEELVSQLV